jgi:tetratricopeptide (TPR) repeat protein
MKQGLRRLAKGFHENALRLLVRAERLTPTLEMDYALALAYLGSARYPEAEERLRKLPEDLFLEPTAGLIYGECLLRQRKWTDVEQWFLHLQERQPNRTDLQGWIDLSRDSVLRERYVISRELAFQAQQLMDAKRLDEARKLLEEAIRLTPERAELHNNLGSVRLKMGIPIRDVLPNFEQAVRLEPMNRRYQTNLAYLRRKL